KDKRRGRYYAIVGSVAYAPNDEKIVCDTAMSKVVKLGS
ncbi:MAG: hypothetical protein QOH90_148, partial [Actinomycetota bacterium]|nr:hypothetical protein [Actinomycetota bacterium]